MLGNARVAGRIGHLERLLIANDQLAEGDVAVGAACSREIVWQTVLSSEELDLIEHQGHQGDRRFKLAGSSLDDQLELSVINHCKELARERLPALRPHA